MFYSMEGPATLVDMWRSRPLPKFMVGPNAINGRQRRVSATTPDQTPNFLFADNPPGVLIGASQPPHRPTRSIGGHRTCITLVPPFTQLLLRLSRPANLYFCPTAPAQGLHAERSADSWPSKSEGAFSPRMWAING